MSIAPGTTVTWRNTDTVSHYVTSGKSSDNRTGTVFDSGNLIKPQVHSSLLLQMQACLITFVLCSSSWMIGQVIVGLGIQPVVPNPQPTTQPITTNPNNVQTVPNTGIINPTQQEITNEQTKLKVV